MADGFAETPDPPYYAVVFTSRRTAGDQGYESMARHMFEVAHEQPGCLGVETARGEDGLGITVAYFVDEASIRAWKEHAGHLAQSPAREHGVPAARPLPHDVGGRERRVRACAPGGAEG